MYSLLKTNIQKTLANGQQHTTKGLIWQKQIYLGAL